MKAKSKPKSKKNKIPLCPRKTKPIRKIIKINLNLPLIKHQKHPSFPLIIYPKKIEKKINDKKDFKNVVNKTNPFHAFIPKRKPNSAQKPTKQKVFLIKKTNKINKNLNLTNSKLDTKCDTTSGINSVFSDRNIKQDNKRNNLEFTFSDINFLKNNSTKNNNKNIKLLIKNPLFNINNNNHSHKKRKNKSYSRIVSLNNNNNNIKNLKTDWISNKKDNLKESKEKKDKKSSKINKTSKISKKFINLIPYDKRNLVDKKTNINNIENNNRNNIDIAHTTKNKDNSSHIHRLLLNISPKKGIKTNKSNPKLNIRHPSLKNLFRI